MPIADGNFARMASRSPDNRRLLRLMRLAMGPGSMTLSDQHLRNLGTMCISLPAIWVGAMVVWSPIQPI